MSTTPPAAAQTGNRWILPASLTLLVVAAATAAAAASMLVLRNWFHGTDGFDTKTKTTTVNEDDDNENSDDDDVGSSESGFQWNDSSSDEVVVATTDSNNNVGEIDADFHVDAAATQEPTPTQPPPVPFPWEPVPPGNSTTATANVGHDNHGGKARYKFRDRRMGGPPATTTSWASTPTGPSGGGRDPNAAVTASTQLVTESIPPNEELDFLASMTFGNGGLRAPSCPCCY
jgi:hypothetical protein